MDWKTFFDRLGMNGTRWQWRMIKWERDAKAVFRGGSATTNWSVTRILISLNVILFLLMIAQAISTGVGISSIMNPGGYLLIHAGAQFWPLVLANGEWWRCITYAFVHGGLIHITFNMVVLYQIGPMIEEEIGTLRFITLYILTALTATALGFFWQVYYYQQWVTVVGASGSLFGLIGFAISYYHRVGGPVAHNYRNFMLRWAAIAFVFGLLVGADNAGHAGGAMGGALLGWVFPVGVRGRQVLRPFFNALGVFCVIATAASLLIVVASWVF
ncbi:MAG: rhomboid family intramembrane serine protease [Deltaproteobacteria bacterium]|jgi:rhomboid protease GluP|nr:rhomboid family intramembrane serine protease [Deltaproteobacteria bacterium]MBW2520643.1 rhomboid family intramembrane serine protease [Deltaproteobacteria bacterium]